MVTTAKRMAMNGLFALTLAAGAPALLTASAHAQPYTQEQREDWHQLQNDRAHAAHEQAERDQALRHGDVGRAMHEQRELNDAKRDIHQDRRDLHEDRYNYGR